MRCPSCGFENREGRRFCAECGVQLSLPCPSCGFPNEGGEKFCGGCGLPLTGQVPAPQPQTSAVRQREPQNYTPRYLAEKILTSRAALEGERKQVTVLFADLKGSMELLADRDPEEARQLLDPVLAHMMAAVHRYEGTVNQVMGDGIMALFGAPIAHEDHAVRGCYAALAMQEAIRRYSAEVRQSHGIELQIRVGLNSGEVVVRAIDNDLHMDYSAIGQTTHLAARMEQLAPPGSSRVTADTLRLAEGFIAVNPLGPVPVRGLAEPVEVFELLGVGPARTRLQAFAARGLTHEVAYGSLLQDRRHALHARIVEAIEQLYPDRLGEYVERLAHHAFRGEVWDKALCYLRQAGAKAVARSAHREAVAYYEQALVALQHLTESRDTREQAIDLRLDLRYSFFQLLELGRLFDHLREAETLAEALGDQRRLGRVYAYTTNYFVMTGDHGRALEAGQRALAIATALGDLALHVETNLYLGHVYYALGDHRRAMDFFRENVASLEGDPIRERFGLPFHYGDTSPAWLAWCLAEVGAFAEGIARGEEAVRIGEAVAQHANVISVYFGVGHVYLRKGDLHKAIPVLERGLGLCQAANVPLAFPVIASLLGYAYALDGRVTEALPLLEQAVAQAISLQHMAYQALRLAWLSEAYRLAGRMDDSIKLAGRALELARAHKERGHEAWALRLLGEIVAQREPPEVEQAEASYRQALALAEELGMRPLQAHCHLGLGTLYLKMGRLEQARAELAAAIELFRSMDMTFWLPQVEAALAQVE